LVDLPSSPFHMRIRLQKSLSSLTYRYMVRCIRRERKWCSWWIDFWERHRCSKVNRVLPRAQRFQHNPEAIGYCMTGQWTLPKRWAEPKGVPLHRRKGKGWGWGYCSVIRQILQGLPIDISLQLCPRLSGVIGLGCDAGPQCGITLSAGAGWDEACSWRRICLDTRPLYVEDREHNRPPSMHGA
jgi:hypothetical protein